MSDKPDWLADARALCDAATPGPWAGRIGVGGCDYIVKAEVAQDAAFIAAARTALPRALTALEAADALAAWLEETTTLKCEDDHCWGDRWDENSNTCDFHKGRRAALAKFKEARR